MNLPNYLLKKIWFKYLYFFFDFQKRENNRLHDEVKSISRDKDHIQSTIAKMHKKEEKVKHELESNTLRMKEAEGK